MAWAAAAAGLLAYVSGRPVVGRPVTWALLRAELCVPDKEAAATAAALGPWAPRVTASQALLLTGVAMWGVCLLAVVGRVALRHAFVPRAARRAGAPDRRLRRAWACLLLAGGASAACVAFGWEHRAAVRWVELEEHWLRSPAPAAFGAYVPPLPGLGVDDGLPVLLTAARRLPSPRQRAVGLKMLVETAGEVILPIVLDAARLERDPAVRAAEIQLASLSRDPPVDVAQVAEFLGHADASARAAAADAVGVLRAGAIAGASGPSAVSAVTFQLDNPQRLESSPPIELSQATRGSRLTRPFSPASAAALSAPPLRARLERMMLTAATRAERDAAARALVDWPPPDFRLRVAEWGVWAERAGRSALVETQFGQIPPFVHQTGNPLVTFDPYLSYTVNIFKPVVHLTTSAPMAADVEVHVHLGRPWYAYPRPDDFTVDTTAEAWDAEDDAVDLGGGPDQARADGRAAPDGPARAAQFDNPKLAALPNVREGYPWLFPPHRWYRTPAMGRSPSGVPPIFGLGLHWQSLVLVPGAAPSGASISPVPDDPKYRWWSSCRGVGSDWVTSAGETERFLYYDGPTRAGAPVGVSLNAAAGELTFTRRGKAGQAAAGPDDNYFRHETFRPLRPTQPPGVPEYEGLYVVVSPDGAVAARRVGVRFDAAVKVACDVRGKAEAIGAFQAMATSYGLTSGEAGGLIAAWTPEFFERPGRRFLLRISSADYGRTCPLQVRPAPTEVVRLGILWTEFP